MSVTLCIWIIVISTEELILPLVLGFSPGLGPITYTICQFGLGYAILKYAFLDSPIMLAASEILDGMDTPVILLDPQLRLLQANRAGRKLFDMKSTEISGIAFPEYVREKEHFRELCRQLPLMNEAPQSIKMHLLGKDGPALYIVKISLLRDKLHDVVGFLLQGTETKQTAFINRFSISGREFEVILEILNGKTIREISSRLYISELTVKSHITHIYTKTGTPNRVKLLELLGKYQITP